MFPTEGFVMRSRDVLTFGMPSARLGLWVGVGGVVVGTAVGMFAGSKPLYVGLFIGAVIVLVYFFADFERSVIGLLLLRSSLDIFSAQQIPAVFAIGIDALTLLYVTLLLLNRRTVHTDWFWWFLLGWVMLQGLWPIFCVLGGLGLDSSTLPDNIREWTRLFSWLMVYLLVMQLKNRLHPEKIISLLFISLIPPVTLGLLQKLLDSRLPPPFASGGERINGTFAHPNNLVLYLLLFIGLTWWKLGWTRPRWPWILLLSLLAFIYVGTGAIFGLVMLCTFFLASIVPKLKLTNAIGGVLIMVLFVGLFASTEFGRERFSTIAETPLLNLNMDMSRAILSSQWDFNSFNWRLSHWHSLLESWQRAKLLGYGLATSTGTTTYYGLSPFPLPPHNDYIRALVEGGIVGLVIFLVFLGAQGIRLIQLIWRAPRGSAQHDLCLKLFAIFLGPTVGMLTDNVWSGTAFYFYWWTVLAIAGWNWNGIQPVKPVPIGPLP